MAVRDDGGLGYLVWEIIGGSSADIEGAAHLLSVKPQRLRAILRGHLRVSQEFVRERSWAEHLARTFPLTWAERRDAFGRRFELLSPRRGGTLCAPLDRGSFGYTLWLIIGGRSANVGQTARRLGLHPLTLSEMIQGKRSLPRKMQQGKEWIGAISTEFPESWARYADAFHVRLNELRRRTVGQRALRRIRRPQ